MKTRLSACYALLAASCTVSVPSEPLSAPDLPSAPCCVELSDTRFDYHGSTIFISVSGEGASDCRASCLESWISIDGEGGRIRVAAEPIKEKGTREAVLAVRDGSGRTLLEETLAQDRGDPLDYLDNLTDDEALTRIYEGFPESVKAAFGGHWTLENIHANALPVIYWSGGHVLWYEVDGPLPEEIGAFRALTEIRAQGDSTTKYAVYETAPFPESIAKCTSLVSLTVKNQPVTGPVPEGLQYLPNLRSVTLTGLDLEGPIPSWCSRFDVFSCGGNRLSGEVPEAVVQTRNWEIRGARNLIQQPGYHLFVPGKE